MGVSRFLSCRDGKKTKKRREGKTGRGEGYKHKFFYSLLPPLSLGLLDSCLHQPFPSFPTLLPGVEQCSALRIPAQASWEVSMPSSQTSLPSLVFTLSRSQANLTECSLPRLGGRGSTQLALLQGPFRCPPHWMLQIPKTGIKSFKKEPFTLKTFLCFPSQRPSWDEGLKTMYSSKS